LRPAWFIACLLVWTQGACDRRSVPDPADGGATDAGAPELGADQGPPADQGGPGTGHFGDRCDEKLACSVGLLCVSMGGAHGFCSTSCPKPGEICKGATAGTVAVCLLKASGGKYYCAFLCKTATASWPCPKDLTCSTTANPPGSKQYICIP